MTTKETQEMKERKAPTLGQQLHKHIETMQTLHWETMLQQMTNVITKEVTSFIQMQGQTTVIHLDLVKLGITRKDLQDPQLMKNLRGWGEKNDLTIDTTWKHHCSLHDSCEQSGCAEDGLAISVKK